MRVALLTPLVTAAAGCFLIDPAPPWSPDQIDAVAAPVDAGGTTDAPWPDPPRVRATRTAWSPVVQTLRAPDSVESDWFGSALALSADGRRAAIASPNDRTTDTSRPGSVRVFEDDGAGTFVARQLIRPPNVQHFGTAVAIEGDSLAITDDGNGNMTLARVHMYRRDAGGVWQPEWILATTPTAAMVGDELHFDGGGRLLISMANQIQTYEYAGNGTWPPSFGTTGTLLPPSVPRDAGGIYASSFAIDGDRLVVGDTGLRGPNDTQNASGGAVVYDRTANGWVVAAVLPPVFPESHGLGMKVAISGDDIAVAGTTRVEMWHRGSDGSWTPAAHLWVEEPGSETLQFGASLVLTPGLLLVGSGTMSTPPPGDRGHAFRFVRSGTTWTADGDLVIALSHVGDNLGIAMDSAANRIAVGANYDDSACPDMGNCNAGAVHVITMP